MAFSSTHHNSVCVRGPLSVGFVVLAFLVLYFSVVPAFADDQFDAGWPAFKNKDYQLALKVWKPLADRGNVAAQFQLGLMYRDGIGVQQDQTQSLKWFEWAADNQYPAAQVLVGTMYEHGTGVEKNAGKAAGWFQKAAEHGNAEAQYKLSMMFMNGEGGLKQDWEQAYFWCLLSDRSVPLPMDYVETIASHLTRSQKDAAITKAWNWRPVPIPILLHDD